MNKLYARTYSATLYHIYVEKVFSAAAAAAELSACIVFDCGAYGLCCLKPENVHKISTPMRVCVQNREDEKNMKENLIAYNHT